MMKIRGDMVPEQCLLEMTVLLLTLTQTVQNSEGVQATTAHSLNTSQSMQAPLALRCGSTTGQGLLGSGELSALREKGFEPETVCGA